MSATPPPPRVLVLPNACRSLLLFTELDLDCPDELLAPGLALIGLSGDDLNLGCEAFGEREPEASTRGI
jgi:hypothetical protein